MFTVSTKMATVAYTVQELVTLLAWVPEDFQVTGVQVTLPK